MLKERLTNEAELVAVLKEEEGGVQSISGEVRAGQEVGAVFHE